MALVYISQLQSYIGTYSIQKEVYWQVISFIDIKKRDALLHMECIGVNNLVQKLQESRKTTREENDWFRKANNQSNKVLKKNSLGRVWIFKLV